MWVNLIAVMGKRRIDVGVVCSVGMLNGSFYDGTEVVR